MNRSKQSNTLLNYFTKNDDNSKADAKPADNRPANGGHNGQTSGRTTAITPTAATTTATGSQSSDNGVENHYKLYDLVWAKLEGYPWWPSIVCLHPSANTHVKRKGKAVLIHVQFFDDPVSRAWIRFRDLKEYFGKHKSDVPLLKDQKWNQAIEFADQALKMDVENRYTLIADLRATDDEDMETGGDAEPEVTTPKKVSKSSPNKSSSAEKESPKENTDKLEPKSDLKRKASHRETDRKKFKRIALESSEDDSGSEFKVSSEDDDSSDDEDVKQISDEDLSLSDLDEDSDLSDFEPKSKRNKSSKSKSASKSKSSSKSKKSSKKSKQKSNKKSKKRETSSDESDVLSLGSDFDSSDSDSKSKKKPINKSKNRNTESDVISLGSDFDSSDSDSKPKKKAIIKSKNRSKESDSELSNTESKTKAEISTPKNKQTNWLTQRSEKLSSAKPTNSKAKSSSLSTPKSSAKKLNKSVMSVGEESFVSVVDYTNEQNGAKEWTHYSYEFLKPEKLKDKKGRFRLLNGEVNPEYDATTLSVPESFLNNCTPALRQWWVFKCQHYDTVLFFKVGKFYELYHMDAVLAVNELQIAYMRGDSAHAGFPEKAFKRYADVLIQKGYKVTRIEQTETPAMMEERVKATNKSTKFNRVVNREVCRVASIGTRMASIIDGDMLSDQNSYLLAVTELTTESGVDFGVCFIDVSVGKFNLCQFSDDRYCSRLRTLIAHNTPVELIFDRKGLSAKTKQLLENCAPNARKEHKKEFWSANKTLKHLTESGVFNGDLPQVLNAMVDETDSLKQTAKPQYELAIRALGAVIDVCTESLIADEVLSMKLMEEYKPCDTNREVTDETGDKLPEHMILDSFTLRNLEIFRNSLGGTEGTLCEVLDFCSTPFGRRLLHKWICSPLCDISKIEDRQRAVTDLSNVNIRYDIEETIKVLKKLPDLERLLNKIHSQGSAKRAKTHPDSRAIFFEMDLYNKRKILDFLTVLDGFKASVKIVESFKKHIPSFGSSILKTCLSLNENGKGFPDLKGKLAFFDNAFDHKKAKQEGRVLPQTGADPEFDDCVTREESIVKKLDNYLVEQRKFFGCNVTYFGTGKNRYQLEVPESATKRIGKDNNDYQLESSRKGYKRYSTPFTRKRFEELMAAEDQKDAVLRDVMRRIFEAFDNNYSIWLEATNCLSLLDVFLSLSKSRSFLQQNRSVVCYPKFSHSKTPSVDLVDSRNPCLLKYTENFIPNDIKIDSELLLLTGPNMGGKSTLMRQLGLIVVMAQIGACVPAKECSLTPVDRIFTRLGAFDRIVEGESTFFVELSETAVVLKHSTKHSLVLIDELGRGTSTFDGTAIACAVTKELSENIKCRTLFSSHYHSLVDEFRDNPSVKLVHMACMIENENESDPTEENITFLYKLKEHSCPKSYGFNAAMIAGLPRNVVQNAYKRSKEFERQNLVEKIFTKVMQNNETDSELMSLIPHLKSFSLNNN